MKYNKTTIIGLGVLAYFLYTRKSSADTGVLSSNSVNISAIKSGFAPLNIPVNPVIQDIDVAMPNYDIPINPSPSILTQQVVIYQPAIDAVSVAPATQTATQTVETKKVDPMFTIPTLKPEELQPVVEITKAPVQTLPPPFSSIMPTAPGAIPGPESVTLSINKGSYAGPFVVFKDGVMHTYTVNNQPFIYTGSAYYEFGFVNDQDDIIHEIYLGSIYGSYNNKDLYNYAEKASILLLKKLSKFHTGAFNDMKKYVTVKPIQIY